MAKLAKFENDDREINSCKTDFTARQDFVARQNLQINVFRKFSDFADFRTSPLYTMRRNYDYNRYRLPKAVFQAGEKRKYAGENRTESTILVADIQKSIR